MDNLSDVDEIPPTPNIQQNKFCSIVNKTKQTTNSSRKIYKNDHKNIKRKRIISPDFKKVKQKSKQATIYSFFVNTDKNNELVPHTISCSSRSPVKINLLNKFEKCDTEVIGENNIKFESSTTSINKLKSCETEIPDEIPALQIDSQEHNTTILNDIENNMNICDSVNPSTLKLQEENINKECNDIDQTFSWMDEVDVCEKDKENVDFNCNFSSLDISSDHVINANEYAEGSVKYKVKDVQRCISGNEIKLLLTAIDDSDNLKACYLRGFWTDSIINKGDVVHVLKSSNSGGSVIDNDSGFLVVNPDFLISSTAVVSTLFCMRKAVLSHTLPQWSPGNTIMMIGSLVHDIFQKSVNSQVNTPEDVLNIIKTVMKKRENLNALCCQDMTEIEIEEKVCKFIPNIVEWIKRHCNFKGAQFLNDISITKVEDIEENVWCPKYGVKGKIDMTVNVYLKNQGISKLMPLELKTGRPTFSAEHVGQVNLYSLMMEERSKEVSDGILLYLRDKAEMKVIAANHHSKRGLIQLRNELASFIYKWVSATNSAYEEIEQCHLPRPINDKRLCEKCPYLLPCTVYQKAFKEKSLDNTHAMTNLVPYATNHLEAGHIKYFLHWSRLLLLEHTTTTEVKTFWSENAINREKKGMCLSYVLLDESNIVTQENVSGYFIHTFIRSTNNPVSAQFKNSCLKEGDYVTISNQNNPDEVAFAMGYIITVCDEFIQLAIERNLQTLGRLKNVLFRIDKHISNSAAACVQNNLMLLMEQEVQANRLRKFIIDKELPNFLQVLPKQVVLLGRPILKSLNKIQQKAVLKAMMAEDYFLIKGMPGTGKTSTIVALVRLLTKMNVSVLLTSYTHSAVDNILLRLKEHENFVRIGPSYRIHPDILEYSFENVTKNFNSVNEFSTFMKEKMVVATTCLGINHVIFKVRKFDVCIIDEASQINQIACMGPLFLAKKFILVGDDKQLPPLVLNREAQRKGMQESLFQRLQNSHNTVELTVQYRMNKEIMRLCNKLTYNGALQCGSEEIANSVLQTDSTSISTKFPSWLQCALATDLLKSAVFLNTDHYKTNNAENSKCDVEAELVILILQFLIQHNISSTDIGIIAPYRKQVDLIETKLKSLNSSKVEVNTVDQYQGRDKEVIIISCVRPNDAQTNPETMGIILDDEKRLNVAISRAKTKLIMVGSKTTLCNYKAFKDLLACLRKDQLIDII